MVRPRPPIDWRNVLFLGATSLAALVGVPLYFVLCGPSLAAFAVFLVFGISTGMAITGGYHRLFSHVAYEAHWSVRLFYLVFGAAAFENSVLKWVADHRRHHKRVDTDLDPYNIRQGFFYAHILWALRKDDPTIRPVSVADLARDPLIRWQHRFYLWIAVAAGVVAPWLSGLALGDGWGGFLVGGFARIFVIHHATFSVNSVAHFLGSQPYSDRDTSRDSFITALITLGEGYHNFHHAFPSDYRNGTRAHHFDPTKWAIGTLAYLGLARKLKRTPLPRILRARVQMHELALTRRLAGRALARSTAEQLDAALRSIHDVLTRWQALATRYEAAKLEAKAHACERIRAMRADLRAAREEFREAYANLQQLLRSPELLATA